jgi:hypothetical protein
LGEAVPYYFCENIPYQLPYFSIITLYIKNKVFFVIKTTLESPRKTFPQKGCSRLVNEGNFTFVGHHHPCIYHICHTFEDIGYNYFILQKKRGQ